MKQYIIKAKFHDMELFVNIDTPILRFFFVQDKTILNNISFTPVKEEATTLSHNEMAHGVVRKLYDLFGGFEYRFNIVKL